MALKEEKVSFLQGFNSRKKYSLFSMLSSIHASTMNIVLIVCVCMSPKTQWEFKGSLYDNGGMKSETGRDNRGGIEVGAMGEGFDQIIMYIITGL